MDRRRFIQMALAGSAAATAGSLSGCDKDGPVAVPAPPTRYTEDGKRMIPWRNWSGYLHAFPKEKFAPADEQELQDFLRTAPTPIRPAGSSHSFSPLLPTDGSMISLRRFTGMLDHDPKALTATFAAGTQLGAMGDPLHELGQAMPNMPDIDEQTLAGSMATATHGSGAKLPALHANVQGLRLVTPNGEVIDCSRDKNTDVFKAAQVSLGALGVVTRYTLDNVPTYRLKRRTWAAPLDELLDSYDELAAKHHSFEMYYIPYADIGLAIGLSETDEDVDPRTEDPDNDGLMELKKLRDTLGWWPGLRRWVANRAIAGEPMQENVDYWHRIYPSDRAVRFNEMEYHLPRESMADTVRKIRHTIESNNIPIFFPIEIRYVAKDDAWLSPFYQRESCSIAVHRVYSEDPKDYFAAIEPIYQPLDGRPHWGKMNTLSADRLAALYPKWNDFKRVRQELDPQGKMLNPYLQSLFAS